jgi:hypothetical protein
MFGALRISVCCEALAEQRRVAESMGEVEME